VPGLEDFVQVLARHSCDLHFPRQVCEEERSHFPRVRTARAAGLASAHVAQRRGLPWIEDSQPGAGSIKSALQMQKLQVLA